MDARRVKDIGRELCELFTQQMNVLTEQGGLDGLNEEDLRAYNERRHQINLLRSELAKFARSN